MGIWIQKIYRSGFTDSGQLTPNDRISKNRLTEQPDNKKRPSYNAGLQRYRQGIRVDAVARLLERKGIKNYMVDIGGEVVVRGKIPK